MITHLLSHAPQPPYYNHITITLCFDLEPNKYVCVYIEGCRIYKMKCKRQIEWLVFTVLCNNHSDAYYCV